MITLLFVLVIGEIILALYAKNLKNKIEFLRKDKASKLAVQLLEGSYIALRKEVQNGLEDVDEQEGIDIETSAIVMGALINYLGLEIEFVKGEGVRIKDAIITKAKKTKKVKK